MTQSQVRQFLAIYFGIVFGAVFLRIDYFPLSWVPMYGLYLPMTERSHEVGDSDIREHGFRALRANGEQTFISATTLNIPFANFRRLYHQRAFNRGTPDHIRQRVGLASLNRWWHERFIGPDPAKNNDYASILLRSINVTLGYSSANPLRIVRLEAQAVFATYLQRDLEIGDLSKPRLERRVAVITEQDASIQVEPVNSFPDMPVADE